MKRRPGPDDGDKAKPSAYSKGLALLARREHSRQELRQKLGRSGYDGDEAVDALNRLGEQRYQDDDRFAEMLIRSRQHQGYGPARVRLELRSHGLADVRIRELIEASEFDWDASAASQLRRRYGNVAATDPAERARRAQFLLRRGFSGATVRQVTHAVVDDSTDESF